MKRILTLIIIGIAVFSAASAQKGLAINDLFDGRFRADPSVRETRMEQGENKDIHLVHSLLVTDNPAIADIIEPLVRQDGKSADDKITNYIDGKLFFGSFKLKKRAGRNRYIIYANRHLNKGNKIVLLYVEGDIDEFKFDIGLNDKD